MDIKANLTNESILKKFNNNFDLVNYAIQLATNMIKSGRAPRVRSDLKNQTLIILQEIAEDKDYFEPVKKAETSDDGVDE